MSPPTKDQLRTEIAATLRRLSPAQREAKSAELHQRLLTLPEVRGASNALICLSFGEEPDTWGLVDRLSEQGVQLWIPRTVPSRRALELVAWPCELVTRSFGLREPLASTPALPADRIDTTLDVALVLGLGFDRSGVRLGHGAGYFDRFLQDRSFATIGLAFDEQLYDKLPRESHDVPMTMVVTPGEIVRPGEGRSGIGNRESEGREKGEKGL